MKGKRALFIFIVMTTAAILFVAFWPQKETSRIRIGSILALTGDYSQWGEQIKLGLDLGASTLPDHIRNRIEIVYYDHQGIKDRAMDGLQQMRASGISFCAEIMSSGIALHTANFFNQNKILVVSGANTLGLLSEKGGPFFFRIIPSDALAAKGLADWAIRRNLKRAILVNDISEWGLGLKNELRRSYPAAGGILMAEVETREGASDFSHIMATLIKEAPDVVFLCTYPREAALIIKEMDRLPHRPVVLGTDNFTNPVIEEASNFSLHNVYYVIPTEGQVKRDAIYKNFLEAYHRKTGSTNEPPSFVLFGYDVAQVIAHAAVMADGNPEKAIEVMHAYIHEGLTGHIAFDANGDLDRKVTYDLIEFKIVAGRGRPDVQRVKVTD